MKEINEKYFTEPIKQNSIEDILEPDEKILKRTKPQKRAYILASVVKMLPIAVIWLIIDVAFLTMIGVEISKGEMPKVMLAFLVPFFLIHLAPVWIWITRMIKAKLEIKNIEYVFTDRRVIIRSGIIVDFKFLYYDKIESVNARVGLFDRLCKVGDIYITAAGTTAVLFDQSDPYMLATTIQRIANDIKADIAYPNALRPEVNPGYNTSYAFDFDKAEGRASNLNAFSLDPVVEPFPEMEEDVKPETSAEAGVRQDEKAAPNTNVTNDKATLYTNADNGVATPDINAASEAATPDINSKSGAETTDTEDRSSD